MTFQSSLQKLNSSVWMFHLPIPEEIARHFLNSSGRRVICTLAGEVSFHCAIMPMGEQGYVINVNKEIRQQLGLELQNKIEVELEADESEYGINISEEMKELLAQDEIGSRYFHQLTPGRQRSLIYMATKPKTSATRLRKALVILEYLKTNRGQLDYQTLQQAFKEDPFR